MSLLNEETEKEFFEAPPPPAGGAVWMLSFADLLSVLLTFFVMLYSTTAIQNEKWQMFLDSFKNEFHLPLHSVSVEAYVPETHTLPPEAMGSDLDYLKGVMTQKIATYPELREAKIIRSRGRLLISFPLESFFKNDVYSAKDARPILDSLVATFNLLNNRIDVAAVIPLAETPSDLPTWQQSLLRADRIAREMTISGYHSPMNAYSYLSVYAKGKQDDDKPATPRIDFVIRETANP